MSSSYSDIDSFVIPTSIPYEEVESATNNFADENLVSQTSSSKIYKGRVKNSAGEYVNIVVRTFMQPHIAVNEVVMLNVFRHKNILPIYKVSETVDGSTGMMINMHEANESMEKHLSNSSTLSWMRRLHICVGVARALCYLHYDATEDHIVIHGNIKSSKILLAHDWEPKLHGFRYAVIAKRNQVYLTDKYNGSLLYMDPAYETTRGLTNKSDVFSFGVVLFEVLFGMEAYVPTTSDHKDNWYFARMARVHYEEKTLDEKIDPDLQKQMNLESLNIFSEISYFCLKEQRSERPDMKKVLQRLQRAWELQRKHESPEHSMAGEGTSSNQLKVKTFDHIKVSLRDIKLATNNFSSEYCIGSGGFATVYKAEIDHFDGNSSPTVNKGEKRVELTKKRSTVAIKRISKRVDGIAEKGFLAEIELLSKCKHPNIVSLIGFCNEEREMILIYEYASNGSLEDYLGRNDKITNLTWAKRIKICINIAYGLEYLHKITEDKECIIHRDIKSANILLDDKWEAKIADFGLSKLHPTYNQRSTLMSSNIGGTQVYLDPEYEKTGKLKTSSDIYSFGVVLCEIMSGKLAYDNIYNTMGLPSVVRRCLNERTIEELVDPQMKESVENTFVLNDGLNSDSFYKFSEIASQCVAEAQADRPKMEFILKELEDSLNLENNRKDNLQISLEAIKVGTQNFSECNCTGKGRSWRLYEGEICLANANNGRTPVIAKRFDSYSDEGNSQFMREVKFLFERKHKNIVGLVGYCNEMGEKLIVYEHAFNGTLDKHLDNAPDLTWMKRLKISLDVARGLEYLHTGGIRKDNPMVHRDIKSGSILLDGDWRAKLCNLEKFSDVIERKEVEHMDDPYGSLSYLDPQYKEYGFLIEWSDMYSFGVVLLEMLLGRLACAQEFEGHSSKSLVHLAKRWYEKGTLDEKIFAGLKEQIVSRSLDAYSAITFKCLEYNGNYRPDASEAVKKLMLALEYQEDCEIWEPRLPKDYEKLYDISGEDVKRGRFKDFYDMLCDGFFFQEGKAWFSLRSKGKRNVMISARLFSYTDRSIHKWQSISESRFQIVAQMLDISNLKIRIKIKPQLLLAGENYGVYLVFKLLKPKKCLAKHMYVNLKYKWESNNLHTDFATWREDGWMMIELCQILNYKQDTDFEVFLESFSRAYCGRTVYIEGIEFQTIDNAQGQLKPLGVSKRTFKRGPFHSEYQQVGLGLKDIVKWEETQKYEDIKKLKEVRLIQRCSNMCKVQQSPIDPKEIPNGPENVDKGVMQNEKISFMLSKIKADPFNSLLQEFYTCRNEGGSISFIMPSAQSRFRQVFGIKGMIESQRLSPDTDYMCYLVFKLSEKCNGLHCPVKVRHGLQWKNQEIGRICFRPPIPWNLPDSNGAPRERDDGCMEVIVWKFNSNSELKNDHIPMNLKFITYEGTMSGLIVCGLEIRSM